jgi:Protein of unknown function (DUF3501)
VDPAYPEKRELYRAARRQLRKQRGVFLGPHLSAMFENYDTVWIQLHEMITIEQVPEDGLDEEIDAYAPLIPRGSDLGRCEVKQQQGRLQRTALLFCVLVGARLPATISCLLKLHLTGHTTLH